MGHLLACSVEYVSLWMAGDHELLALKKKNSVILSDKKLFNIHCQSVMPPSVKQRLSLDNRALIHAP